MRSSLFLILSTLFGLNAQAEDKSVEQRALEMSANISEHVEKTAEAIDIILAGKRYTNRVNETTVNVSQLLTWSEGGKISNSTDFGVNLRLPNVEKRWQVRFSNYNENEESRDLNQRTVRTTPRQRDYGAALYFFKKLGNVRTTFQPRIQLKNPLQMSYVLRFESAAERKPFRLEPRLEFYADSLKGTGEFFSANFIYHPGGKWEFGLENQEEYRQKANYFTTGHGITADYALSDKEGLGAAAVTNSENHNFHLSSLTLATSYNRVLYKDLLKFSLSPFLGFGKADRFKGRSGISLTVDAMF